MSTTNKHETLTALAITNVVLAALSITVAGGFLYFRFFYEPQADPQMAEAFVQEAQERWNEHADQITAEATSLVQEAAPPIANAVYDQAREDYPAYVRALKTQGREYLANVEQIFIKQVKAQYGDYLRAHRDVVKQEFPEHASDENVEHILRDFEETANRIVERYYLEEFHRESDRTVALWQRFELLEQPGPDEPSLQEQLADYTADWVVLAASDRAQEEAAPEKGSPSGEPTSAAEAN